MNKYRSFTFTLRPLDGAKVSLDDAVVKWLKKYKGFLCAEKEGVERHLHGQIFYENPVSRGDLNKQLTNMCERVVENWNSQQNYVMRRGTKISYDDNFIDEYLSKEDKHLYVDLPDNTSEYYPSKEEQAKVQAKSNAIDKRFHEWETDFKASQYYEMLKKMPQGAQLFVSQFLEDMMFCSRKYPVVVCPKKRKEYAKALLLYVTKCKDGENTMYKEDYEKTLSINFQKELELLNN